MKAWNLPFFNMWNNLEHLIRDLDKLGEEILIYNSFLKKFERIYDEYDFKVITLIDLCEDGINKN